MIYSLDIGSDSCSDLPGGTWFDPGDMYDPATVIRPFGANGVIDDSSIFFPFPDPAPQFYNSVPFMVGGNPSDYFDMDGFSWMPEEAIAAGVGTKVITWNGLTNEQKMAMAIVPRLEEGTTLAISFDDDGPTRWCSPGYQVPVNSVSPMRGLTYGSTASQDEIVFLELRNSLAGYPSAIFATSDFRPGYSESTFDLDLSPDPTGLPADEILDDDIDALFAFPVNPPFYFGADAEASKGFNPGSIYHADGGALGSYAVTEIANAQTNLKLNPGTDIDDFEFAWLKSPITGKWTLIVLFTVDDDDPTTPEDESGGLDPSVIYGSTMTGAKPFKLFEAPSVMYGLDRNTHTLYRVDRLTGLATSLGIVPSSATIKQQMAADTSGRLWVIDGADLYKVDVNNPAASTFYANIPDLAGKQVTDMTGKDANTLYALVQETSGYDLWTIDIITATAVRIGSTGVSNIWGLACDIDGKLGSAGLLYAVPAGGGMYTIDPVTAVATDRGCGGACAGSFTSLAIDTDGTMFTGASSLARVDARDITTTAPTFTSIGPIGAGKVLSALAIVKMTDDIDAIAISSH